MRRSLVRLVLMAACAVVGPLWWIMPARAQGTARSLDFDSSLRAAGMGGAGAGVAWGAPSVWGNPAALGIVRGLHWEHTRTRLVPGLAENVYLETDRAWLGLPGLAFSSMGKPLGELRLDYGLAEITDTGGTPIGTFSPYESAEAWGVAVSLVSLVDGVRQLAGLRSDLAAFGDFSYGYQRKHATVAIVPDSKSSTDPDAVDWGVLARISPIHQGFPDGNDQFALDLGYGASVLSANDAKVDFGVFGAFPVSRIQRVGGSVRVAFLGTGVIRPGTGPLGLLAEGATPLAALSFAVDEERISAGDQPRPDYSVQRNGFEVGLANMAFVRFGHVNDVLGDIVGDTFGWGLQLPISNLAGVRYDHAKVPQARGSGLEDVKRNGWSAWFDPIALMRRLRHHPASISS